MNRNAHHQSLAAAQQLNRDCFCRSVDHDALRRALAGVSASPAASRSPDGAAFPSASSASSAAYDALRVTHPNLFSDVRVHVAQPHLDFMAELVRAVERIVALPAWREHVLAYAPDIARHPTPAAGVMLGYDFHLDADGPRLIEINTNAGGALLNARLLAAQCACSPHEASGASAAANCADGAAVEADFVAMFREEWELWANARSDVAAPLARVAIVDDDPPTQFLAPEFELFRQLFEANGIACVVVDTRDLIFDGVALHHDGRRIDLVYNRLTDFALDAPASAALRAAYLADAVLVTPHPRAHALYADKRNLVALSDDAWLQSIGVPADDRRILAQGVPATRAVTPDTAQAFWTERRQWFFKPRAGYGSRAAYRGDKLTKRVFAEIARGEGDSGGYIAQALVRPSERWLRVDGVEQPYKVDLRNYVYCDRVQLVSARLYQGQTTNFRTPGGGFAAVYAVR